MRTINEYSPVIIFWGMIILIILKILGISNLSWWVILFPLFFVLLIILLFIITGIISIGIAIKKDIITKIEKYEGS